MSTSESLNEWRKKWKCAVSRNTNAGHGHLLWPNWTANRKLESHLTGTDCVKWSLSKANSKRRRVIGQNFHSAKRFATKEISFPFFGGSQLSVCLQVGSNVNFGGWNCAFSKFERFQPETRDGKLLSESCHLAAILRTTYQKHIVKCYKNQICC